MTKIDESGCLQLAGLRVGDVRFYKRNGRTYARMATTSRMPNCRSEEQMANRLLFNSARMLWRPLKEAIGDLYEEVAPGMSAYTTFVKLNHQCGVFLSKADHPLYAQVITPVQFSQGTLAPIAQQLDGEQRVVTDIGLGPLEITEQTTIAEFAKALQHYDGILPDDELVFVAVRQMRDANGRLVCKAERTSVRLDYTDQRPLQVVCGALAFASHEGFLATQPGLPIGCYGYCIIRKRRGVRQVSTQRLVNNNAELLAQLTSREKFDEARDSYGKHSDKYMRPSNFHLPKY